MSAFEAMNWPYTVSKIIVTLGYTNQTTGAWVAESTVKTTIDAHISDLSIEEMRYIDPGIIEVGARKIAVEATVTLDPGDRIEIYEDSAGDKKTEWNVESQLNKSGLMNKHAGINRSSYLLSLRE
jgi:putative ubiquitin-RnfH superfamily antitoxin RatB of RatAB toxin-antitoxin module